MQVRPSSPGPERLGGLPARARLVALLLKVALLLAWISAAPPASAHEYRPGVLALKEASPGRFLLQWSGPMPPIDDLEVQLPGDCTTNGQGVVRLGEVPPGLPMTIECRTSDFGGELSFTSSGASLGRIGVNVEWLDGSRAFRLTSPDSQSVSFGAVAGGSTGQVLGQYLVIGVEHIWLGVDHLLFLLGLLILGRGFRQVVTTVTAFTLAHSLTLGAASLELLTVPIAPVEICIALSVLLLAVEATRQGDTLSRRKPWLIAFGFGLLHGLGFAAALSDVGLPKDAVLLSLFAFNVGVELGQLVVVALVALSYRALPGRTLFKQRMETGAVWVLGTCSVFWLLQRVEGWLVGG